ncbi:MAG: winged helix-turn-helix domain-containing protein [Pseudomonadota bacterium]
MYIELKDWRFNSQTRRAERAGDQKKLSPRATRALVELAKADGSVLSRQELLDRVWPNVYVTDESLTKVVSEIRQKLQDRTLIETIAKGGYRLNLRRPIWPAPANIDCPMLESTEGDLEAHALCHEARAEIVRCGPGALERSEALTAKAVELAPGCAEVRAERAIALVRSHTYWSEGRSFRDTALTEAHRAVELQPALGLAHSALGYAQAIHGQWHAAELSHSRAVRLASDDPMVLHNAGWYLMYRGKIGAAVCYFEKMSEREALNIKGYAVASQLCYGHSPQRAERNAKLALSRAHMRLQADPGDFRAKTAAASLQAILGDHDATFAALERIDVQGSPQAIYHAKAMAYIGEDDRAWRYLEDLFDHGWRDVFWLANDPFFSGFRDDTRYTSMKLSLLAA